MFRVKGLHVSGQINLRHAKLQKNTRQKGYVSGMNKEKGADWKLASGYGF
jgi:hypothetical protein